MTTFAATCHTEGCPNAGVALDLEYAPPVDLVVCGACGEPITDTTLGEVAGRGDAH